MKKLLCSRTHLVCLVSLLETNADTKRISSVDSIVECKHWRKRTTLSNGIAHTCLLFMDRWKWKSERIPNTEHQPKILSQKERKKKNVKKYQIQFHFDKFHLWSVLDAQCWMLNAGSSHSYWLIVNKIIIQSQSLSGEMLARVLCVLLSFPVASFHQCSFLRSILIQ